MLIRPPTTQDFNKLTKPKPYGKIIVVMPLIIVDYISKLMFSPHKKITKHCLSRVE